MQTKAIGAIVVVILLLGAIYYFGSSKLDQQVATPDTVVAFACTGGKAIEAGFSDGIVALKLSDGRSFTLEQVISASGARFANEGEAVVFWNKGRTAFLEEAGSPIFVDCVQVNEPTEPINTVVTGTISASSSYPIIIVEGKQQTLYLDELSVCAASNGALPCVAMSSPFDTAFGGRQVAVEGIAQDEGVLVRKLTVLEEGQAVPLVSGTGSVFISWAEAQYRFRQCEVESAMQTHALDVYLNLKDGRDVRAVEPVIDEVFAILDETRQACGTVPVATE